MKLSIITVCFNAEKTIEKTFQSVLDQNINSNIEHLIIDGASKDQTLVLAKAYQEKSPYPVKIFSEPDKGLYDAMNKGIQKAAGEFIHFLNADDVYAGNDVLSLIKPYLKGPSVFYGNTVFKEDDGCVIRRGGVIGSQEERRWPMKVHQPALFVPKQLYQKGGLFNLKYKIAADFEMTLRLRDEAEFKYIDLDIVRMDPGGLSDRQALRGLKECLDIAHTRGRSKVLNGLDYYFWMLPKHKIKKSFPGFFKFVRQIIRKNKI